MSADDRTSRASLDWLFGLQNRGMKLGLESIRGLLGALGDPQVALRCLHVAGTNGKGSVCALAASVSRSAGLRTGLFTSPHLVRFHERIQVDGVPIGNDELIEGLARIHAHADAHPVTFFEVTTALAFWHFQRRGVDFVALETGLGGRLDATNVVRPAAAVITPVGLDHLAILGETVELIAHEKAGIIKRGVPVVSGPQLPEVARILETVAQERDAPLTVVTEPVRDRAVGLFGSHQRMNAAVALAGLRAAGLHPDDATVAAGLQGVVWPGRFQRIAPDVVLDGAHNPSAARRLVETWREYHPRTRPAVVFGGLRDKALGEMAEVLGEIASGFHLVPVSSTRGLAPDELSANLPAGLPREVYGSVAAGLAGARATGGEVLVTGSLFLVGEVLADLQDPSVPVRRTDQ